MIDYIKVHTRFAYFIYTRNDYCITHTTIIHQPSGTIRLNYELYNKTIPVSNVLLRNRNYERIQLFELQLHTGCNRILIL